MDKLAGYKSYILGGLAILWALAVPLLRSKAGLQLGDEAYQAVLAALAGGAGLSLRAAVQKAEDAVK